MPVIKDIVKERYKNAAQLPDADLCCPTGYDFKSLEKYIPREVIEVSYGCGTPAGFSSVRAGEAVLDIGSGGGIDCFEAARLVGPEGKVVGVDMTDDMLSIARRNAPLVARNLGLNPSVIEFRKGEAEDLPVENEQFDLVISNCVINLSPDKAGVFEEIYRVLRPGGRFTISDIVSDQNVPEYLRTDEEKWGACLSGSLQTADYLKIIRKAGFVAVEQIKFNPWKKIDGINFYAITVRAYKLGSVEDGKSTFGYAIYRGPFSKIKDERGNAFQRGQSKKISKETAQVLSCSAYKPYFILAHEASSLGSIEKELTVVLPEEKKSIWRGEYAILTSLFLMGEDDDRNIFYAGQPLEICDRTKMVLEHEMYKPFFSILSRTEVKVEEVETSGSPKSDCC